MSGKHINAGLGRLIPNGLPRGWRTVTYEIERDISYSIAVGSKKKA
jgi:hypothetical protein